VTFQQVQKYEKGVNRVGAGRLTKIAEVLGVPVGSFFSGKELLVDATGKDGEASPLKLLTVSGRSACCAPMRRLRTPTCALDRGSGGADHQPAALTAPAARLKPLCRIPPRAKIL
jgi:hypothetical protein